MRWDTVTGAAFDSTNGPRNPKVKEIRIETGAGGGALVLQIGGLDYFSFTVPANTIITQAFIPPQYMPGLAMTTKAGTNTVVVVTYD
jgi:hypothetical protein